MRGIAPAVLALGEAHFWGGDYRGVSHGFSVCGQYNPVWPSPWTPDLELTARSRISNTALPSDWPARRALLFVWPNA